MKALLIRLTLWLVARLDINPVEEARLHGTRDEIARGERWEGFYNEEGGLRDMLGTVRKGYFEAASALSVGDTGKLYEYALADRLARELEREVLQVVMTGKARAERERAQERTRAARILRSI